MSTCPPTSPNQRSVSETGELVTSQRKTAHKEERSIRGVRRAVTRAVHLANPCSGPARRGDNSAITHRSPRWAGRRQFARDSTSQTCFTKSSSIVPRFTSFLRDHPAPSHQDGCKEDQQAQHQFPRHRTARVHSAGGEGPFRLRGGKRPIRLTVRSITFRSIQ